MSDLLDDLTHFLQRSPTSWHAVQEASRRRTSAKAAHLLEERRKMETRKKETVFCSARRFGLRIFSSQKSS